MEAVGLRWFEQPVPRSGPRRHGPAGTGAGHEHPGRRKHVFTPEDVFALARHEAADVINIKCSKYGLGNARRMAAVARAANLPCMVGSMQSMGLGLAAGLQFCAANNFPYACELDAVLYLVDDVLAGDPFSQVPPGNAWPVPEGAGYGVTLKSAYEEALDGAGF